jgi:restriction system protein
MEVIQKPLPPNKPDILSFGLSQEKFVSIKAELERIYLYNEDNIGIYGIILSVIVGFVMSSFMVGLIGVLFFNFIAPLFVDTYVTFRKTQWKRLIDNLSEYEAYSKELSNYNLAQMKYERELDRYEREQKKQEFIRLRDENRKNMHYWSTLNPYIFEREIANLFLKHGFSARVTKGSGDGGIDIVLFKNQKNGIVQCKRHKTKVSPGVIREIYGAMIAGKYEFAYVVCPAGFSEESVKFSRNKKIHLIGLKRIMEMVNLNTSELNFIS